MLILPKKLLIYFFIKKNIRGQSEKNLLPKQPFCYQDLLPWIPFWNPPWIAKYVISNEKLLNITQLSLQIWSYYMKTKKAVGGRFLLLESLDFFDFLALLSFFSLDGEDLFLQKKTKNSITKPQIIVKNSIKKINQVKCYYFSGFLASTTFSTTWDSKSKKIKKQ